MPALDSTGSDPKLASAPLQVLPFAHDIVVTVPAAAFGSTDPATATYQVSMFSDAQDDEGIDTVCGPSTVSTTGTAETSPGSRT